MLAVKSENWIEMYESLNTIYKNKINNSHYDN